MTTKDYIIIAQALKISRPFTEELRPTSDFRTNQVINNVASELAAAFALDNPNFNRDKFMEATR